MDRGLLPLSPTLAGHFKRTANQLFRIGSEEAPIACAGVSPTFAGLYEVKVIVPVAIGTGDDVPLTVSIAGRSIAGVKLNVR